MLLVVIGTALNVEAFLPREVPALLPDALPARLVFGSMFGLGIGLASSPLVFAFGADTKAVGPASLLISLPTVARGGGVQRYHRRGAFGERKDPSQTVAPMGLGSVI